MNDDRHRWRDDVGVEIVQAYKLPRRNYEVKPEFERFSLISYTNNREAHKTAVEFIRLQICGAKRWKIHFTVRQNGRRQSFLYPRNGI